MAEQIGLEAVFDMQRFDQGIASYIAGVRRANEVTDHTKGSFGAAFDDMGNRVLKVAGMLSGVFVAGAAAAGAAVGAFVASGVKGAMNLESQMGAIAAVMGETKDAVGPLKELILDLGLDPNLKVNAQEAADAIEKLAANGLEMTQIMNGAAKATVLLANSTAADFDTAAAIATDTMALFNIKAEDMMTAVNGITGVTVSSKFAINDYRLALSQAGGVASATGVSFEDFNTTIAGIANYFASGSDAGTSFKTMLLRLVPTTSAAAEAMGDIGLTTVNAQAALQYLSDKGVKPVSNDMNELYNQAASVFYATNDLEVGSEAAAEKFSKWAVETGLVQSAFFDANGQMRDMSEISALLNTALAGLSEQEKNKALNTIFGTDAMRAAVGLAEQGQVAYTDQALAAKELGVSYDSLTAAMEGGLTKFEALAIQLGNTDAAEAAKVRMDNFKGSMEILQGVIDTVALKIGFAFLPVLKTLADRASELITQYAPMITTFFENFAVGIEKIVNGTSWREVFPVWLTTTIDLVAQNMDILTGALAGVAALLASAGLAAAFSAISVAMAGLLSPMTLLIGGAAVLGIAWNTNFLGLRDTTLSVITAVMGAFAPLTAAIQEFRAGALAEIWAFATGNYLGFASVIAIWNGAVASVQNLFTAIVSAVTTNLPVWIANLTAWGAAMGQWITDAATKVSGQIATWTTALVTWLSGEGQSQIGNSTGGLVSALIDWITTDLIPKVGPAMLQFGLALGGAILNVAAALGIAALSIGGAIWAAIMATDWKAVGTNILTYIKDGWEATKSTVLPILGGVVTSLLEKFTSINWSQLGTDILTFIKDGYETAKSTVLPIIGTVATSVKEKFTEIDWKQVGTDALTLIKDGVEFAKATVLPLIGVVATSIETKFSEIDWKQLGTDALTYVKDGFETTKAIVLPLIGAVATSLETKFTEIDWKQLGTDALTLIKDGWEFAKTTVLPIIGTIATSLKDKFNETDWKTLGTDTANAIRDGLKAAADLADGLIAVAGTVATSIKDAFTEKSWTELGTQISNDVKTGLSTAANAVDGLVAQMGTIATDLGSKITATDWQEVGHSIARLIKDGLKAAAEALDGLLAVAGTIVTDVIKKFTDGDWSGTGTTVMDALRDALKTAAYAAAGLIYIAGQIAIGMLEEFTGLDFDTAATAMMNALRDGIKAAAEAASGLLAQATTTATDLTTKFTEIDWQNEVGKFISDDIRDGITGAVSAAGGLYEIVTGVGASIKKTFTDLAETWKTIGSDIVNGIGAGITAAKDTLIEKAKSLADSLPGWVKQVLGISSPSKVFMEIGRDIVAGLIVGIEDATGELKSVVNALFGNLSGDQIAAINITVSDEFAKRAEGIIGGIESQIKALGDATQMEEKRLDLLREIETAYQEATEAGTMDDKTRDKINEWTKQIDEINEKTATRLQLEKRLEELSGLDASVQKLRERQESISLLEDYLSLLENAGTLGIDISGYATMPSDSVEMLQTMVELEDQIATIRNEQLRLQAATLRQTLQERAVARDRAYWLQEAMKQLQPRIAGSDVDSFFGKRYKAQVLDPILETLKNVAEVESERNRLIGEYAQQTGKLQSLNYFQNEASLLEQRVNLLKQAADLGIDISNYGVDYNHSVAGLQEMVDLEERVAQAKIGQLQQQGNLLKRTQQEAAEEGRRVRGLEAAMNQLKGIMAVSGTVTATFAQRMKAKFLDPIIEQLQKAAGIDTERIRLINEYATTAQKLTRLQYFESINASMGDYLSLLKEASALKIDISKLPLTPASDKAGLEQLVALEEQIARAKFDQLVAESLQLRQKTETLKPYQNIQDAITHVEKVSAFMSDQLAMMKKAESLGLNLGELWSGGIIRDSSDMQRILSLQLRIASASGMALENQMATMIAEQRRAQGLESAMRQLQPLIDQTNVSSAFGQKYKAEVLDPMLRALQQSAGIDAERVRLINEYTAAAQRLIEINKKEDQLGFLQQQLDVVKMIADQDIVGGASLFDGIAFGVNASIDDLLTLTNRVLGAMITEVKDELGIHSPSKVFAEIGSNMMKGLANGIQNNYVLPLNNLRQSLVPRSSSLSKTINFAMGGVNIYSSLDEVMLENRILRVMERAV